MRTIKFLICISILFFTCTTLEAKDVSGWVEPAVVYPNAVVVNAKLDTGAASSSLHCECISVFNKNGQRWIRFGIKGVNGQSKKFEKPVIRMVRIKRHFGDVQQRPVVKLDICVGGVHKEVEVNLIDRSGLNYPMLIGRNFLAGNFIVDAEKKFLIKKKCKDKPSG